MKLKNKENIILYFISIIITAISYTAFLKGYYSIDTPKIIQLGYDGYAIAYSFYDGRLIMTLIGLIANIISIGIKQYYILLLIFSIIISSISVIKIYTIVTNIKQPKNKMMKIIVFIAAYTYIFHFMNINNFQFVECIIMSMSILFYILSAEEIILKTNKKMGFIYCLFAILCYQGTINVLISTAILMIIIKDYKINKKAIKQFFDLVVVCIIAVRN